MPILATKLYIPAPRPTIVRRTHLLDRLNAGLQRKLTLISAPAGFGKTTLVSEWVNNFRFTISDSRSSRKTTIDAVEESQIVNRVAWLSLDEGDSDLTRFLTYLIAALQTIDEGIGSSVLGTLQSAQPALDPAGREAILTALLNEIAAVADNFILVLDDYHLTDAAPPGRPPLGAVDSALTFLIDHLPPQIHVVITTREDPDLPLARYRARGQLTEVRAADLRFTPAEAADFLNQAMGLDLATEEIAALETRTEGWIAGLQLAALSMQGHAQGQERSQRDRAGFIRAFAGDNRYIVDYLVEEVLQHQPEPVQRFLLQTSILDRLSGSLCDAVTGQENGSAQLTALERGNLFVIALDDKRHWYRYHHLFADVLYAHLLQDQPDHAQALHRRASDWYDHNDEPGAAIRHAVAAKDFARAAALVERAWPAMDQSFQAAAWLTWARALPDELVRSRPVLGVAYAWALLNGGELEAAETRLRDAERWLDGAADQSDMIIADKEQFQTLPASIATARAYLTQARGDLTASIKYCRQALDLLPAADHLRRGPAAALLGLAYWAHGDLEAAYQAIADAMANFQQVGNLHFAISGAYGLADIRTTQGRLRAAIEVYEQALQLALAQGKPSLRGTADLYLGLSDLAYEQGDLDAASAHLLHSEELGEQAALPDWRYRFHRTQARFKEIQGDLAGALDLLDEATRHYHRTPVPDVRPLAALKARVWIAQGRIHEALDWARERGLSVDDDLSYLREFEHITLAKALMAEYRRDPVERTIRDALRLLERLSHAAEAGGRMGSVIAIGVLQALAHQAQGDLATALIALERALALAGSPMGAAGYVRVFVDEGPAMAELLSAAAARGIMPDYSRKLLSAFAASTHDKGQTTAPQSMSAVRSAPSLEQDAPALVEPLSERELEVLQLVAQGFSNREISERLFLALSTVKGHNRNIFGKLQVQRRTEAVARARELGLV